MARFGLKLDLAAAIKKVVRHKLDVVHRGLRIDNGGGDLYLDLTVKPIFELGIMRGMMMVIFDEIIFSSWFMII